MPSQFASLDTGFPSFTGHESTEEKVEALYSYTFMLLENLRYILRNLGPENFNTAEMEQWLAGEQQEPLIDEEELEEKIEEAVEEKVEETLPEVIRTTKIVTNELYAQYGAIADLVVDELRTDYRRAAKYLSGDTSNIDYIHIHDEEISFITGTVKRENGVPLTEQLHHGNRYFCWTDALRQEMTSTEVTLWPVIVYQYDEAVKGRFYFIEEADRQGNVYKVPMLKLGQGSDAGGINNTARIVKHTEGLDILYNTTVGTVIGLKAIASGFLDLYGVRRTTDLDLQHFPMGFFQAVLDGNIAVNYGVDFDANGDPVRIYDSAHSMDVTWW